MGRKSSAKAQSRSGTAGAPPPEQDARSFTPLLAVAIVIALVAGVFVYTRRSEPTPTSATQAAPPAQAIVDPPVNARYGPNKQDNLPPLPFDYGPPARPAEVVKAVYEFAAEHPEVLGYVPCYCGCERESGHRGNDDCFVAERNTRGDVTRWDPHGVT
jgi:hypothetical protein